MAAINPIVVESSYYEKCEDGYNCLLCPNKCYIKKGDVSNCGSRRGEEDILSAYTYGRISWISSDPIEKKPLYHYFPKSKTLSIGSVGCNMKCRFCQNYAISQSSSGKKRTTFMYPQALIEMFIKEKNDIIAFTYNEPTIWYEYIQDVVKSTTPETKIVITSNGYCNEAPLKELCKITDAFNIDIKGFTDDFYTNVCSAQLDNVLDSIKIIYEEKSHLELTYLLIPGYNDSKEELTAFAKWVNSNLNDDVPVHISRFHPDNEMRDVLWTSEETLNVARDTVMEQGLKHVYLGNILSENGSNTTCPKCGFTLIKRVGYIVDIIGLDGCECTNCGNKINIQI